MNPGLQPRFPSLDALEAALWPGFALLVFVATAVLVDAMIIVAARWRLVDLPNRRSAHSLPTAGGGGVGIAAVTSLAMLVTMIRWPSQALTISMGMLLPCLIVALVGLLDDIRPLSATLRLGIQCGVAIYATMVLGPVERIGLPGAAVLELGWLGWPLTVLWIVGLANAWNFMDGSDGMAALGAVAAGLGIAAIRWRLHDNPGLILATSGAAAAAGFLVYNWQPARIFMGDAGSGFLGTFFATLLLLPAPEQREETFLPSALALWPYIYDPFLSVLRRVWNGAHPFRPHREFLFHRLIRSGVSHARTALLYAACSAAGGLLGLAMLDTRLPASVRGLLPLGIVAMGVGLTWAIEHRCHRVGLTPAGRGADPVQVH